MKTKTKNILGWSMSGLAGLMLAASALDKITGSKHALEMGASFGLSGGTYSVLGVVELLSVGLFLFPRTGILGTLLLSAYLGGAIATHLQHGQSILFPMAFQAVVWVAAVIRFPELTARILANRSFSQKS